MSRVRHCQYATNRPYVTQLLNSARGDPTSSAKLLALVYDELRSMAQSRMGGERAGHTLEATGLVHEVFLKLVGREDSSWQDRGYFYAAAAKAMQQILIDYARRRKAEKRGGDKNRLPIRALDLAEDTDPDQVIALDEAMRVLENSDPRAAAVVRMRFFAGLDVATTAEVLGISERTVMREWAVARARLFASVSGDSGASP